MRGLGASPRAGRRRAFLQQGAGILALVPFGGPLWRQVAHATPGSAPPRPFRLLLDPGHGGENHGCRGVGTGLLEKEYTLQLCQDLAQSLAKTELPLDIAHTRRSDMTVSATERARWANDWPADLLLSLHANASPGGEQRGFESFVLSPRRRHARRLLLPSSEPSKPPLAAWSEDRKQAQRSHRWARYLQQAQREAFADRLDRGVRGGNFDILVECRVPCILHEFGFLDHPSEGRWMQRASARSAAVSALQQAIHWILADAGYLKLEKR